MSTKPSIKKGERFGKLEIQEWDSKRKEYLCKCDCGNFTYARSWSLKNGRHKACKCGMKNERFQIRLPDNLALKNSLYRNYKNRANKKRLSFSIEFNKFCEIIQKNCFYCGVEPQQKGLKREIRNRNFKYNGLDRIDNSLGYTLENCVPCCEQCNNSKKTLQMEEWMLWINRLTEFQKTGGVYKHLTSSTIDIK